MTRNDIIVIPDPRLRERSKRIGFIDDSTKQLAQDMIDATLDWEDHRDHESGAALAAVQVGRLWRIVIIRNDFEDRKDRTFGILVNPEIVKAEGEPTEEMEGCLSVGDIYGSVMRYPKVKVKAQDLDGKQVRLTATGFLARVLQHEIDHTNGVVFVDRVDDPHKLYKLQPDGKFKPVEVI
jgi:peptide deformylase